MPLSTTRHADVASAKVAIVTGGTGGIGRQIVCRLASLGILVVAVGRSHTRLRHLEAKAAQRGWVVSGLSEDLRQRDSSSRVVGSAVGLGGGVDILINCAGSGPWPALGVASQDEWEEALDVKVGSALRLSQEAWSSLSSRRGVIVNIAGVAGRSPTAESAVSAVTNAALCALTKAMADRGLVDGVRVNAVNPGPVRTSRFAKRVRAFARHHQISTVEAEASLIGPRRVNRVGAPSDVANLVAYVVSSRGRLIHGAVIDIDGGATKGL